MDNQDFSRLDLLSKKSFNKTITPCEFDEYLYLLDEWEVIDEQNPVLIRINGIEEQCR